jgi:hypothetical protein
MDAKRRATRARCTPEFSHGAGTHGHKRVAGLTAAQPIVWLSSGYAIEPIGRGTLRRMEVVLIAVAVVAMGALWAAARGAITICVIEVSAGHVEVLRGGVAPRVLADIEDVVTRPRVDRATLRIVRDAGRARLEAQGALSSEQLQRLRNVIGSVPLAALANARRRR